MVTRLKKEKPLEGLGSFYNLTMNVPRIKVDHI